VTGITYEICELIQARGAKSSQPLKIRNYSPGVGSDGAQKMFRT